MPRGNSNAPRGQGGFRGDRGGRGGGRGRGGRGGRGRGRGLGYIPLDLVDDFVVNPHPSNNSQGPPQFDSPRGRGRGRGRGSYSGSGQNTPMRGNGTPRGRGRGGAAPQDLGPKDRARQRMLSTKLKNTTAPLSQLLHEDRPFLKPIIFVRSQQTPTLFTEEEEIFQPVVEETGDDEASHVPTADLVIRVFSNEDDPPSQLPSDMEGLEEIDFGDMGKMREEVEALAAVRRDSPTTEQSNGNAQIAAVEEQFTGFYIDTQPSTKRGAEKIIVDRAVDVPLGELADEDDEVIVYVAPHPRTGKVKAAQPPQEPVAPISGTQAPVASASGNREPVVPASGTQSIEVEVVHGRMEMTVDPVTETAVVDPTEEAVDITMEIQAPAPASPSPAPAFADVSFSSLSTTPSTPRLRQYAAQPRSLRKQMHQGRITRAREQRRSTFGSFGAMMSEAQLRDDAPDPRRDEQRRGDSDVDWGDDTEEEQDGQEKAVEGLSSGVGGMELDEEIGLDAMKAFVKGMGASGSQHVTMQDLAIDERMKMEDEESEDEDGTEEDESGEDEEVEEIVRAEEKILVAEENGAEGDEEEEDDEDDDEDEDSSDEDVDITPKSGFQARLERLRARTKGRPIIDMLDDDEFDEDEDDVEPSFTWGDGKDELTAQVQEFLDENAEILKGRDHKETNRIFKAIYRGDFDFDINYADMSPSKRKEEKDKDIPIELRDQWNRDRAKKADHKRAREKARLETAADPLAKKKGGKKGRKAMMAAAALDPSVEISNRVVDMASMEQQIRRFLANIGGPNSMSLPPMEKYARKTVHELATAFNLKSQSKGKGNARYTTLSKTTRSGVCIDEKKINKILRKAGVVVSSASGGRQGQPPKLKPREGEIVGKAAPKIGESNVGFKMLAAMGWLEGSRIGTAGGIDVPLTAVIKNTKLGLGHK